MIASPPIPRLLLADDNPDDQVLIIKAWQRTREIDLQSFGDGESLLNYLHQNLVVDSVFHIRRPQLIMLDLRMPKKNGFMVISELKAHGELKSIPVVVMTTSDAKIDIQQAYALGANSCVVKPDTFGGLLEMIQSINQFWFETVAFP